MCFYDELSDLVFVCFFVKIYGNNINILEKAFEIVILTSCKLKMYYIEIGISMRHLAKTYFELYSNAWVLAHQV